MLDGEGEEVAIVETVEPNDSLPDPGDIVEVDLTNASKKWRRVMVKSVWQGGFIATHPSGGGECACGPSTEGTRWRRIREAPEPKDQPHLSARDWIRPILDEHFGAIVAEIASAKQSKRPVKFSDAQLTAISRVFYGASSMIEEWPGSDDKETL